MNIEMICPDCDVRLGLTAGPITLTSIDDPGLSERDFGQCPLCSRVFSVHRETQEVRCDTVRPLCRICDVELELVVSASGGEPLAYACARHPEQRATCDAHLRAWVYPR
jgi:hypothetical protein